MAASRIKQPPVEFLNRKPIPPRFETVMPGDQSRLPINELVKIDPISSRLQNLSRILMREYQCFRMANGGPDSFFQAFGVALLEHYARKTTDLIEIEDFRKWIKAQVNGTQVRQEAEEEYKLFLRLIGILSQDKRENPWLSMYQLQNLLLIKSFNDAMVKVLRMIVANIIEEQGASLFGQTAQQIRDYLKSWQTCKADDFVFQVSAISFSVHLTVEDCSGEYQSKTFRGSEKKLPRLTVLKYKQDFVSLYRKMINIIDGFQNNAFNVEEPTANISTLAATECYQR